VNRIFLNRVIWSPFAPLFILRPGTPARGEGPILIEVYSELFRIRGSINVHATCELGAIPRERLKGVQEGNGDLELRLLGAFGNSTAVFSRNRSSRPFLATP